MNSLPSPPSWAEQSVASGTIVYPESSSIISFANVLLIDANTTIDFETIYRSVNASTFPVMYSHETSGQELLDILSAKVPAISRLGLCFALGSGVAEENLFVNSASFVAEENIAFVVALLNQFAVANIDYLACSSLESSSWSAYYAQIIAQTSAQVGASNDKTGNIRYGGDWVMESTGQDVEAVYFTGEIQNYQFLLDTFGDTQSVSFVDGSGVPYGLGYNFRNQFCNQPNGNGSDAFTFCNIYAMVMGNLPAGKKVASVSSHGAFAQNECVLSMTDGSLFSPSNGTFVSLALPAGKTSAMIAISYYGVVSLMTDGTLYVKGWVTPAVGFASAPTSVWNQMTLPAGKSAAYVFCVPNTTAVVMTDGTLYAYGTIIGLGSNLTTATQISIPDGKLAKYAFATSNEICVLTTDGLIYYRSSTVTTLTNKALPSGNIAISMALSNSGLYVLDLSKNLYAIGSNFPPGVGLGSNSTSSFAAMNGPSGEILSNIQASGGSATLLYALTLTGNVYVVNSGAVNSNNSFQLGQGDQTVRTGWVQVKTGAYTYLSNIRKLSTNIIVSPVITRVSPGLDASGNNTLLVYFSSSEDATSCTYTVNGTSYTTSTQLTSPIVIPASQLTLANGSSYTITLAISNSQYTSSASVGVAGNTYLIPDTPTGVSATAGGIMTSTVSWTAPTNVGVPALDTYRVSASAFSSPSISFTASTTQYSGLPTNQYTFMALSVYGPKQLLILGPQAGSLQYARINNGSMSGSLTNITATGLPDNQFTGGAINSAGTRIVVSYGGWGNNTNKLYWADTTNILNSVNNTLAFTQILDTTVRNYFGVSMTGDGSMIVVAAYSEKKIYYSTWNGTNYSALTLALTCDTAIFGVALNKDGTKLFYSYDANKSVNSIFWVPITNGTTFGTPVAIGYLTGTGFTRTITCSEDGSLIFIGAWTNEGAGQFHGYAYWTGTGYSQVYSMPTTTFNNQSNTVIMAIAMDSVGNLYHQPYNTSYTMSKATFNYTPYANIAPVNYDTSGSATSLAVGPLLKDTTYTFSVKSGNGGGYSASSSSVTAKTANVDAPGSPTISSSSVGNGSLTFTFAAPAYTGTPSLTGYYYSLNDVSNITITNGTFTISRTGMLNQAYVVKVYATNGQAATTTPATVTLTPYLPPNPPTIVSAVGGLNSAVLTFTDGSANGSAITNYKYSLNGGSYTSISLASSVSFSAYTTPITGTLGMSIGTTISAPGAVRLFFGGQADGGGLWYSRVVNDVMGTFTKITATFSPSPTTVYSSSTTSGINCAINAAGTRLVVGFGEWSSTPGMLLYWADTTNVLNGTSSSLSFTQIGDSTKRFYIGLDMTADGSRIVACSRVDSTIYFSNWNGTNYNAMTATSVAISTATPLAAVCISKDGSRIACSGDSKNVHWSDWNGTNYGAPTTILGSGITDVARDVAFINGTQVIFVGIGGPTPVYPQYCLWNGTNYSAPVNITALPTSDSGYGATTDVSNNLYWLPMGKTTLYKTTVTYSTTATPTFSAYTTPLTGIPSNGLTTTISAPGPVQLFFGGQQNGNGLWYSRIVNGVMGTYTKISATFSPTPAYSYTASTNVITCAINADGTRLVVAFTGNWGTATGLLYWADTTNVLNGTSSSLSFTQIGDSTQRFYGGVAMSADGSRIVACSRVDGTIYYGSWNGTNYGALTATSVVITPVPIVVCMSSDGSMIACTGDSKNVYWSKWNGTNYGAPTTILGSGITDIGRSISFVSGTQLIFVGMGGPLPVYPQYCLWNGTNYSAPVSITTFPTSDNGWGSTVDSSNNLYWLPSGQTNLYKSTVTYNAFISPYTISSLTPGSYSLRLRTTNAAGDSIDASASFAATGVPDAPVIGGVTASNSAATVYYTCANNGFALTSVWYNLSGGAFNGTVDTSVGNTVSPFSISGLTNGVTYTIRLKTANVQGNSAVSAAASFTPTVPQSAPGAPTINSITAANGSLVVAFTPGINSGSPIIGYKYSTDGTNYYLSTALPTATSLTILGLTNATAYTVYIKAVSGAGDSAASNSMSGTPAGPPSTPFITGVASVNSSLVVSYMDGSANGSAITGYNYSLNGSTYTSTTVSGGTFTLSSPTVAVGSSYTVYMKSQNSVGSSSASNPFGPVAVYAGPIAPVLGTVTASDSQLSLAFTQASNGYPILRYEWAIQGGVWSSLSSYFVATSLTSPIVITGLTNGITYTIYVRAITAAGTSASVSTTGVPVAAALTAPTITSVVAGNTSVSINYTLGNTNGAGYTFMYSLNAGTYVDISAASPLVISGLTNGSSYNVAIKVKNNSVLSAASNTSASFVPGNTPTAPTITGVSTTTSTATISFTDGTYYGATVLGYKYSKDNGSTYAWAYATASPLIVYDVVPGTAYNFKIQTITAYGTSPASNTVAGTTVALSLNAPIITSVVPGNASVAVSFTNGASTGLTITGYKYSINNGSTFQTATNVSGGVMTISTGLTNGSSYTVIMQSVANLVISPNSNTSASFIPTIAPAAPTITGVVIGDRSATVSFTAGSGYGYPVLGYQYSVDGTNYYIAPGSPSSPIVLTGLTNGASYNVQLKAFTVIGTSAASTASAAFVPATTPSAPTITAATPGFQSIALTIVDGNNNGSAITQYSYSLNGATYVNFASTSKPLTISGLTNGSTYTVSIKATTAIATSAASNTVSVVPASAPAAPTITAITPLDKSALLEFTAGDLNGGSLVGYMYSLNGSNTTIFATGTSSPIVIRGLNNASSYTVQLFTVSTIGTSSASVASSSIIPFGTPGQPTIASVVPADQQITVSVTNGGTNGRPITSYKYSFDGTTFTTVSTNPFTITGLTNGEDYSVYVISTNEGGDSPVSLLSDIVNPYGAPGAPGSVVVYPANRALRVEVSSDNMNGADLNGVGILGYKYSFDGTNYSYQVDTSLNTFTTSQVLTNGVDAEIYVKRITSFGQSAASAVSNTIVPCNVPETPTVISIVPSDQIANITFIDGSANGSPILGYKYSFDGTNYITALQTESPVTMFDLDNASSYTVYFKAFNAAGDSAAYVASSPIIPFGVPFAPVITRIVPGNACAYVHFNSINANGNPVNLIRYSIGATYLDASGLTSPITVPNLLNGGILTGKISSPYSIYIAAANNAGLSTPSNALTIVPGVPLPPTLTNITGTNASIVLEFTPPTADNGSAITGYTATYPGLAVPIKLTGLTSPITIPKLVNGTVYAPRLIAVNKIGSSIQSNSLGTVFPYTVPDAVKIATSVTNFRNVQVYFSTPNSNGAPITKYIYNLSTDATTAWYDASGMSSPITILNTPVNVPIIVKMIAVNLAGMSAASSPSKPSTYVWTVPAQIKTPVPSVGFQTMTVPIITPVSIGSSLIKYSYSLNGGAYFDFSGLSPPFVIDISNNVDYNVQLTATNGTGASIPSAPMAKPVRYIYLPPATGPAIGSVAQISVSGNTVSGAALVTFTAPTLRNAVITSYAYTIDTSAGTPIVMGTTVSPATITGISNVVSHTLYLYAVTPAGLSIPTISKPFAIDYTVTSSPVIKTATVAFRNTSYVYAYVGITPPVLLHGSPVSTYYYSLNGGSSYTDASGSFDISGANVNMTISDIPIDVSTNIMVSAINGAGMSAWSAPVRVYYKYHEPTAPILQSVVTTVQTTQIARSYVRFLAPAANGSPITTYYYSTNNGSSYTDAAGTYDISGASIGLPVPNIPNDTSTNIVVAAVNSIGRSVWSLPITAYVLYKVSSAPGIKSAALISQNINYATYRLSVLAPLLLNGSAVSTYYYSVNGGSTFGDASSTLDISGTNIYFNVPTVPSDTSTNIVIAAVNGAGRSNWSAPLFVYPIYKPTNAPVIKSTALVSQTASFATYRLGITPPTVLNGSAVSTYYYSLNSGSTFVDASGLLDISGVNINMSVPTVPNDVSTNIVIATVNGAGRSPWSAPSFVFARYGPPSAPVIGTMTSTANSLTIPFTVAATNGSPISAYSISVNNGAFNPAGTLVSPIVLTGLTTKTSYSIILRATNAAGTSPSSNTATLLTK